MLRRLPRAVLTTALATIVAASTLTAGFAPTATAAAPKLTVTKVAGNLSVPWDVTWVGSLLLFDQRAGGVWSKRGAAAPRKVSMPLPKIFARGEAGMLGMVADPKASTNKNFYTCMAVAKSNGGAKGVEVWKWRLTSDTTATKVKVLLSGIPLTSGRHSGCRLRFRSATMLYIGTGDAAVGTNPQNLKSLGGKVLRIRSDGSIPRTNPFFSRGGNARYVWTYGHRNVQGLTFRASNDQLWAAEHGPVRDDEVNRILKGRNYGWSPTGGRYNENHPMTDKKRFPKAYGAKWRSGSPTVATSGASFVTGAGWQSWNGKLMVAELKGQGVMVFTVSTSGKTTRTATILTGYGRIRTVQQGPDGALYVTTSNGSGDAIYKVTPRK
jgi:glucose/arabinose dehydrogenase